MKNKALIFVVTFFLSIVVCIILFNLFDSETKKNYFFERIYSNKKILKFDKKYGKMSQEDYLNYLRSDSSQVEFDKENLSENQAKYKLYFNDFNFEKKIEKDVLLPSISNVILCNKNSLYFTRRFKFYKFDYKKDKTTEIDIEGLKVFSCKSILNGKNFLLCFGELLNKQKYETGFFVIDIDKKIILNKKVLEFNFNSKMPMNALVYSGTFNVNKEKTKIAYCCDKYSKIYFFDENGSFIKEIDTKEDVPLPTILKNQNGDSFYSRGGTWSTNMGMFFEGDNVYVFSARSRDGFSITIDRYSYKTTRYNTSFKLKYDNFSSKNIRSVIFNNDKVIIGFEYYYASFIFSRYI